MSTANSIHRHYDIGKKLGEGGFGIVHEAARKEDGKVFALKIMDRSHMDKSTEKSTRAEVAILQFLKHPNIVRGYDFIEEKTNFYFVMEKVDGGELFDRIVRKTVYTEREARQLTKILLDALQYLHKHRVAHRDLKPENLLMRSESDDADIKIVDFGFARQCNGLSLSDQCGTPQYVAPEILRGKMHGLPVDMWSFGVILYILLAGYPPFHDPVQKNLYRKISVGQYEFHPKYWSNISTEAKDLISKLLAVNPLERITPQEALQHPWVVQLEDSQLAGKSLDGARAELEKFQAAKKLRAGIKAVTAMNKMMKLANAVSQMKIDLETEGEELPHLLDARYEIGAELGAGGFAVVKEGRCKADGSLVAIKLIDRSKMESDDEKSVRSEVSILQSLEHNNVVTCYDFFEEPDRFCVVLEKVNGGELFDRIVQMTFFTEKEARSCARVILEGLQYCHQHHIAHRDLKPENLLMTSKEDNASVKIVDFGFAAIAQQPTLTDACGTPGYIAPEILEHRPHGTQVDMFSFGVVLYILLAGYPPFHDEDQNRLFKKIKRGVYEFHAEYWSAISEEAKDLIRNLLEVNPALRLTADQALNHPWLLSDSANDLGKSKAEIKKFQAAKRWKKGAHAIMAINKMRRMMSALTFVAKSKELEAKIEARYDISDKVLGEGGYAVVKEGFSKVDGHAVAIKTMNRKSIDADTEESIRREVTILQSLNHPNIVGAYDFIEEPEKFYFVMEKVVGGELFDRIVKKTFYTEKEARDLVLVLMGGVRYMHHKNIVHRDLKPENLLMTSENDDADVKIVDFGFAMEVDGFSLTQQCGTPGYIAPEILENKLHGLPVDCWSLGVIIYILLGGYPPFHDEDQKRLFKKIRRGIYEFHAEYWSEVSHEAKDLISGLLTVNPLDRLTIDQAIAHPWLHGDDEVLGAKSLAQTKDELRKFQVRKKFRKGVHAVLAVNRWKNLLGTLGKGPSADDVDIDADTDTLPSAPPAALESPTDDAILPPAPPAEAGLKG